MNLSSATYQSGVLGKLPAGASSSAGLGLQVTCEVPLTVLEPRVIAPSNRSGGVDPRVACEELEHSSRWVPGITAQNG